MFILFVQFRYFCNFSIWRKAKIKQDHHVEKACYGVVKNCQ